MELKITFETLYELLRKEKSRQEIQKLDISFYKNLVKYLQEKQAILNSQQEKNSIFSQERERTHQEVSNIRKMIKELYEKREQKIMQLALLSSRTNNTPDTTNLLEEEKKIFNELKEFLISQRKGILENVLKAKSPKLEKNKPKDIKSEKQDTSKLLRFKYSVPKFIAEDMKTYGPFVEEDIANLPVMTADVLLTRNKAEEIK